MYNYKGLLHKDVVHTVTNYKK